MGVSLRPVPQDERSIPPDKLWDQKVAGGMSADEATAYVSRIHGPPPSVKPSKLPLLRTPAETTGVRKDYLTDKAKAAAAPTQFGAGLLRSAEQGATFGFGDELNAGVRSALSKETFADAVADERKKLEDYKQANPGTALVSELGGAVGGGAIGGAALGVVGKALGLGAKVAEGGLALTRGQKLLRTSKQIATGAAAGGTAAAGAAEGDVPTRLKAVPAGAAFGAGTVAGLKAVGALADATGAPRAVARLLPRPATADAPLAPLARAAGIATTEDLARADVLRQMQRAGFSVDDVAANAAAATPDQMLLDPSIGGRAMLRKARGAHSIPSQGSEIIGDALAERGHGQPKRVQEALESTMGHGRENLITREAELSGKRLANANPKYDAIKGTVIEDPEALALFDIPEFRAVHKSVARNAAIRGDASIPPLSSKQVVGGVETRVQNPQTLGTLDKVKQHLDDIISGKTDGGKVSRDRAYAMRDRLIQARNRLDELHPEYAEARAQYATDSQPINGLELGQTFLKTPRDELQATFEKLTPAAQHEYRKAALASIEEKLSSTSDGRDNTQLFKNDLMREKLKTIFPTPESFEQFQQTLARETEMHGSKQFVLGGSPTARILAEQADEMGSPASVLSGARRPLSTLVTGALDNALTRRMRGLSEQQINALAPILTARGEDLQRVVEELKAFSQQQARAAGRKPVLRATAQIAGGASAKP